MSNLSLIAVGLAEVREGSEIVSSGVVRMAEGIVASWSAPIRWSYGKGDNEVSGISCLAEMFTDRRHADGSVDGKFLPAMYRAVADCFLPDDDDFPPAYKMQFKRAWSIASASKLGVEVSFVDADVIRKGKRAKVRAVEVPAAVAFDLYDENGVPTAAGKVIEGDVRRMLKRQRKKADDATVRKLAEETPIECIGGKIDGVAVPAVTAIADRLAAYSVAAGIASKGSRSTRVPADKFVDSVDVVIKALSVLTEKTESDFAPSDALDAKLRELNVLINAYLG